MQTYIIFCDPFTCTKAKLFLPVEQELDLPKCKKYPGKRPQTVCVRSRRCSSRKSRDLDALIGVQRGDGGDEGGDRGDDGGGE